MPNRVVDKFNEFAPAFKEYFASVKDWDWRVIGICFFTSFTFWLFNELNDEHNYDLKIPLQFDYDNNKVVILKDPPSDLVVNVTGNGWDLFKSTVNPEFSAEVISFENINMAVNTNFIATNSLVSRITSKLKELQVNYILQDSLFFKFDTLSTKTVQLAISKEKISLEPGFYITTPVELEPQDVEIEGASSILQQMDDTITLSLNKKEIDGDIDENISLDFITSNFLNPLTKEVKISFSVAEFERRNINVGLELDNFPKGADVTVDPGTAVISYLIEKNEQYMPRDSLRVLLDYNLMDRNDSTIKPKIVVPPYFMEYNWTPDKFKITLEK
ncbi:MAG: hypothetical protein CMO01_10710 [Thalassobius sp.]|nr:hypothetical protein [Thalassovita sp.]